MPSAAAAANSRPVHVLAPLHAAGEAVQELGEDRAGVAARAVEGAVGGGARQRADTDGRGAPEARGRCPEGRREVGPGVGVAHREHVHAVQCLLLAHDGEGPGADHAREHRTVEPVDHDHHAPGLGLRSDAASLPRRGQAVQDPATKVQSPDMVPAAAGYNP